MQLTDRKTRYGTISRFLHWGMATMFAFMFVTVAARETLPRGNGVRDFLWGLHADIGITLFLLVFLRGAWGLFNLSKRPEHTGSMGKMASLGHAALYGLMIAVPGSKILAAAGSDRGFSYFGLELFAGRDAEIGWMQAIDDTHGNLAWLLAYLIIGHIVMAVGWHHIVLGDNTLSRMIGKRRTDNHGYALQAPAGSVEAASTPAE